MTILSRDLRYAFRALRAAPALSVIVMLTLSLAIGVLAAVYGVVDGVILRPLPYPEADSLMMVWSRFERAENVVGRISGPELQALRDQASGFDDLAGIWGRFGSLTDVRDNSGRSAIRDPEQIDIGWVSPRFFDVLGVPPLLGRTFSSEEDLPDGPAVILLAHDVWQRRYSGDPGIVGSAVRFNGSPYTVVGVMPEDFSVLMPAGATLPRSFGAWLPWQTDLATMQTDWHLFATVGRLRVDANNDTASTDAVGGELGAVVARLRQLHPVYEDNGLTFDAVPMHADLTAPLRPGLLALLGAAALVVLVACANVVGLLLLRESGRRHETSLRAALGAPRAGVARQTLLETGMLFAAGAVGALMVARAGLRALIALDPTDLPRVGELGGAGKLGLGIDIGVFAVTLGVAGLVGVAAGCLPAYRAASTNVAEAIKARGARRGRCQGSRPARRAGDRGGGARADAHGGSRASAAQLRRTATSVPGLPRRQCAHGSHVATVHPLPVRKNRNPSSTSTRG